MNYVVILSLCLMTLSACRSATKEHEVEFNEDYGLSGEPKKDNSDEDLYFDQLKRAEASIQKRSSLPVPVRVGKTPDRFGSVPKEAQPPTSAYVTLQNGNCQMRMITTVVELDRFMYAGKWIKLNEGLPPHVPLKLEPGQDLFLRATAAIKLEMDDRNLGMCANKYKGRHTLIGQFNIDATAMNLLADPRSPQVNFSGRTKNEGGKKVFLRWGKLDRTPMILDEYDQPPVLETGIFHSNFSKPGYYYVTVRPNLQKTKLTAQRSFNL